MTNAFVTKNLEEFIRDVGAIITWLDDASRHPTSRSPRASLTPLASSSRTTSMLLKALMGTAKDLWQRRLQPAQLRSRDTRMAFAEILVRRLCGFGSTPVGDL